MNHKNNIADQINPIIKKHDEAIMFRESGRQINLLAH